MHRSTPIFYFRGRERSTLMGLFRKGEAIDLRIRSPFSRRALIGLSDSTGFPVRYAETKCRRLPHVYLVLKAGRVRSVPAYIKKLAFAIAFIEQELPGCDVDIFARYGRRYPDYQRKAGLRWGVC